ncbi:hypothetical protein A1D29_07655 [Pasteurellaceae bacterium Orientalotternb1]|nr:hypothetical protein A1D29_07655 [Pasteurellaceae bacterium Orientalotternb1]
MIYVSVNDDLINFPSIDKIAQGVAVVLETNAEIYPNFLGHYSGLDNHPLAKQYKLSKLHIALSEAELNSSSWRKPKGQSRTSNNFVVFLRHWLCPDYVRILDIIHPDAHERIDSLIPELIEKAEAQFFNLGKSQLEQLNNYKSP